MEQQELTQKLTELAQARAEHAVAKADLEAKRAAWEAEHASEIAAVREKADKLSAVEEAARDTATRYFVLTGDVKPVAGVEIKMVGEAIYDAAEAERWVRQNMPRLLGFSTNVYDKFLREVKASKVLSGQFPDLPGDMVDDPKPYLGRDLSAYLPAVADADAEAEAAK